MQTIGEKYAQSYDPLTNTRQRLLLARFRMLECGTNYKGSLNDICEICKMKDDESHRLNDCKKFRCTNFYDSSDHVSFDAVFSSDIKTLKKIIPLINQVWNTRNANGTMIKP